MKKTVKKVAKSKATKSKSVARKRNCWSEPPAMKGSMHWNWNH